MLSYKLTTKKIKETPGPKKSWNFKEKFKNGKLNLKKLKKKESASCLNIDKNQISTKKDKWKE